MNKEWGEVKIEPGWSGAGLGPCKGKAGGKAGVSSGFPPMALLTSVAGFKSSA